MDKGEFISLPPPHESVRVQSRDFEWTMHLVYTGTPEALLAAGAIEPHMLAGARTCGRGKDSRGNGYQRKLAGRSGRIEVIRNVESFEALKTFPGYQEVWLPESIRWLAQNPGKLHVNTQISRWRLMTSFFDTEGCEEIVGTKEALIAHGLVAEEDFGRGRWARIDSEDGYKDSHITDYMDGFYRIQRFKCPPRPEPTREDRMRLVMAYIDGVEGVAAHFSPETQSRVGVHVNAIMEEFDREMRQPAERPSYLRLAVDNTKGGSIHG